MKIEYVPNGIGNNFGEVIELNAALKNHPALHDAVLAHELSHTNKMFTFKDLALDLSTPEINRLDMLKFMLKHPRTFSQLLPFYYSRKHGFVYDINLSLIYFACLSVISVAVAIGFSL